MNDNQIYNNNGSNGDVPGKGAATASLVLGIVSVVCWFFGYGAILSVILGIVGLVMASNAKKAGFNDGIRTAGFVLSLIGLIGGAIALVLLVLVLSIFTSMVSSFGEFSYYSQL